MNITAISVAAPVTSKKLIAAPPAPAPEPAPAPAPEPQPAASTAAPTAANASLNGTAPPTVEGLAPSPTPGTPEASDGGGAAVAIVLVVVVLLALAGGAFFVYRRKSAPVLPVKYMESAMKHTPLASRFKVIDDDAELGDPDAGAEPDPEKTPREDGTVPLGGEATPSRRAPNRTPGSSSGPSPRVGGAWNDNEASPAALDAPSRDARLPTRQGRTRNVPTLAPLPQ